MAPTTSAAHSCRRTSHVIVENTTYITYLPPAEKHNSLDGQKLPHRVYVHQLLVRGPEHHRFRKKITMGAGTNEAAGTTRDEAESEKPGRDDTRTRRKRANGSRDGTLPVLFNDKHDNEIHGVDQK